MSTDLIKDFASERPGARAIYGYGSNVFKQTTDLARNAQTDVIFVVDDIDVWHHLNMDWNPKDYSLIGRIHLNSKAIDKMKGKNHITYFSHIKSGEKYFKYGVIEINDFIRSLGTWDNLFMAGRFQKPTLEVESERCVRETIRYNRECALIVACLFADKCISLRELYYRLCGLSYIGDVRMLFAENSNKVTNIVDGSFDVFKELYPVTQDFLEIVGHDMLSVKHDVLLSKIKDLPCSLLAYLEDLGTDYSDLEDVRRNIKAYFYEKNREESRAQIIEGFKTNGLVRSVPYALAKVQKRFMGR